MKGEGPDGLDVYPVFSFKVYFCAHAKLRNKQETVTKIALEGISFCVGRIFMGKNRTSMGRVIQARGLLILMLLLSVAYAQKPDELVRRKAAHHPMEYYLSLPKGWRPGGSYSVVVAIESADREFKPYAEAFVKARKSGPMIVVVPLVVTNGGPRYKEAAAYHYSPSTWSGIDQDPWKFDEEGLLAVISEVHSRYGGKSKVMLTGLEAGGHTVFAFAFRHPEMLSSVAPVAPNYAGRHVAFGAGQKPPIRCFVGSKDVLWAHFSKQWDVAKAVANQHGFRVSNHSVPGKGHEPLAEEVLAWFGR